MSRLVKSVQSSGAIAVVVSQPTLYKPEMTKREQAALLFPRHMMKTRHSYWNNTYPSYQSLQQAMTRFNQVSKEVAAQRHAVFVDAAARFDKTLDYFVDDCHRTEKGQQEFSLILADALKEAGLVEGPDLPEKTRGENTIRPTVNPAN